MLPSARSPTTAVTNKDRSKSIMHRRTRVNGIIRAIAMTDMGVGGCCEGGLAMTDMSVKGCCEGGLVL